MKNIDVRDLAGVTGGMQWEQFRPSKNVEDRRPEWAKRRDDAWFRQQEQRPATANIPLPPRRPSGI